MMPHRDELEALVRELARRWRERGIGDEVIRCLDEKDAEEITRCCSLRFASSPGRLDVQDEGLLHAQLGLAYTMAGEDEQAVQHYGAAAQVFRIRHHWSAAIAFLAQGRTYARMNHLAEAADCYAQCVQLFPPKDPWLDKARAWQLELGAARRAPTVDVATREVIAHARAHRDSGQAYARQGDIAAAITQYASAIGLVNPGGEPHLVGECYDLLGDAYRQAGGYQDALTSYEKGQGLFVLAGRAGKARRIGEKAAAVKRLLGEPAPAPEPASTDEPAPPQAAETEQPPEVKPPADGAGQDVEKPTLVRRELPQWKPAARPGFTFLKLEFAPVCAERVAAGMPFEPRFLTDTYLVATGIEIEGKHFSRWKSLIGEPILRLRAFDLALTVHGHSMEKTLEDGDCVLVKKTPDCADNDVVVSRFRGAEEDTFNIKRYRSGVDHFCLLSDNQEYSGYAVAYTKEMVPKLESYYSPEIERGEMEVRVWTEGMIEGVVVAVLQADSVG